MLGQSASCVVCPTQLVDLDVQQNVFVTSFSVYQRIRIGSPQAGIFVIAED